MTAPEYRRGPYRQGGAERTEFGARVRARRRELDVTQEELAERLGRSQACLSCWERGSREPSLADLAALAKSLETSTDHLILGSQTAILGGTKECPREAGTSGGLAPNDGGSMQGQRYTQPAWLGYLDGQLVAIELEGFHAGETVADWESRGYRVEQVSNAEAIARWRVEVQGAPV